MARNWYAILMVLVLFFVSFSDAQSDNSTSSQNETTASSNAVNTTSATLTQTVSQTTHSTPQVSSSMPESTILASTDAITTTAAAAATTTTPIISTLQSTTSAIATMTTTTTVQPTTSTIATSTPKTTVQPTTSTIATQTKKTTVQPTTSTIATQTTKTTVQPTTSTIATRTTKTTARPTTSTIATETPKTTIPPTTNANSITSPKATQKSKEPTTTSEGGIIAAQSDGLNSGMIVAIVVVCLLFLAIDVALGFVLCRIVKKQKTRGDIMVGSRHSEDKERGEPDLVQMKSLDDMEHRENGDQEKRDTSLNEQTETSEEIVVEIHKNESTENPDQTAEKVKEEDRKPDNATDNVEDTETGDDATNGGETDVKEVDETKDDKLDDKTKNQEQLSGLTGNVTQSKTELQPEASMPQNTELNSFGINSPESLTSSDEEENEQPGQGKEEELVAGPVETISNGDVRDEEKHIYDVPPIRLSSAVEGDNIDASPVLDNEIPDKDVPSSPKSFNTNNNNSPEEDNKIAAPDKSDEKDGPSCPKSCSTDKINGQNNSPKEDNKIAEPDKSDEKDLPSSPKTSDNDNSPGKDVCTLAPKGAQDENVPSKTYDIDNENDSDVKDIAAPSKEIQVKDSTSSPKTADMDCDDVPYKDDKIVPLDEETKEIDIKKDPGVDKKDDVPVEAQEENGKISEIELVKVPEEDNKNVPNEAQEESGTFDPKSSEIESKDGLKEESTDHRPSDEPASQ